LMASSRGSTQLSSYFVTGYMLFNMLDSIAL
jgi:hypothetical protein